MSSPPPAMPKVRFGAFELDVVAGKVVKNGIPIKLQPQPLRVLVLLTRRAGQVVTRDEIQRCLWGDSTFVDFEHGINFSINQIRAVLRDNPEKPRYIETLPRIGYRFIAPVTQDELGDPTIASATEAAGRVYGWPDHRQEVVSPTTRPAVGDTSGPKVPITSRTWRHVVTAVLVTMIAVGAGGYVVRRWTSRPHGPDLESLRITKLTNSGKAEDVAISPDGSLVVYSQRDRSGVGLWIRHIGSGSEVQILPSDEVDFRGLTFSPDGNSVYFVRSRKEISAFKDLYAMPVLGGPTQVLAKDIDSPVSFSPDGRQFVYTTGAGGQDSNALHIANIDGSRTRLLTNISGVSSNFQVGPAWSPDGRTIVVSMMLRGDRSGFILDSVSPTDGRVQEIFQHHGVIGRPLWLPTGNTILIELDDSSGRGQLWKIPLSGHDAHRITNDLSNWGSRIDATHDGRTVAAIQWSLVSNLWTVPFADPSKARQITFGQTPIIAGVEMPHGKILAVSGDDEPWIMNSDGTGAAPFSNLHDVAPAVMCGPFVILTSYDPTANIPRGGAAALKATKLASGRLVVQRSYQSGPADIMRLDADGLNAKKLASGLLYSPTCSPDGKYIFYVLMGHPQKIMRTPIEGGVPLEIGDIPDTIRGAMRISPDGRFLSFPNDEIISNKPVTKLVIVPANGGPPIKRFDAPSGIYREGCLRWSPNGQGLQYLLTKGDVTNLWEQPVVGGEPSQITHFTSGRMFDFNWSPDGKTLLLSRGEISSDVVLLSSSR